MSTHLQEKGLDIVFIKGLLGHAQIQTAMVYLHVAKKDDRLPFHPWTDSTH
jgi:integrase/recombinase XerD